MKSRFETEAKDQLRNGLLSETELQPKAMLFPLQSTEQRFLIVVVQSKNGTNTSSFVGLKIVTWF